MRFNHSRQTIALLIGSLTALLAGAARASSQPVPQDLPTNPTGHSPQDANALFDQGVNALQQNRFAIAVEALRAALELDPGLVTARYDLGVAYFSLSSFEESRQAFQEVLRRSPGHPFARYFLGRINLVQGNLDAAIHDFQALSQTQPVADELYYLGAAYFRKGDSLQAIRALERASAWKPGDYRAHLLLARAYQKVGRGSAAEKEYSLSENLRASYSEKSREIIECQGLLEKPEVENAVERCRQLLDGDDPTKLTSLGTLLAGRQLYDQAVVPLEKAARLDPENYEPQFNLGLTYFKMKEYREARKPLEAAVALRPESYDAVALLGSVLFALGDDFNAARQLRHAHQLSPTDEKVTTLLFQELRIIAQHFWDDKNYKQSTPFFEEALTLKPEALELRLQLAQAYAALGDKARAARKEKAAGKSP